ncbi:hypothetical protein SUGI_0078240 [Cryptomeria japonica]|nr:hypothetical protein SUGI_0078240 [Cryptomeria japonica]
MLVSKEEDTLFWYVVTSEEYIVKLGYDIQRHRLRDTIWPHKLCWNNRTLPKVGAFLWISLHDSVLTQSRLTIIGITGPSRCVMCKGEEETMNHLLYSCPYASGCWDLLFEMVNLYSVKNEEMKAFVLSWP